MNADKSEVTGRCPHKRCDHYFVSATVDQMGEHLNGHGVEMPPRLAGLMSLRLMDFRRKQHR